MFVRDLAARLATRRAEGFYRERRVLNSLQGIHTKVDNETLLSFCSQLPYARLMVIPAGGHAHFLLDPQVFEQMLEAFIHE